MTPARDAAAVFVQRDVPSREQREWAATMPIPIGWVQTADVTPIGRLAVVLTSIRHAEPYHIATMRIARRGCDFAGTERFIAGQGAAAGFVQPTERGASVLCTLDFDPEYARNLWLNEPRSIPRAVKRVNYCLATRYYPRRYAQFGEVVTISVEDRDEIVAASPTASVFLIPLALPARSAERPKPVERIAFVGSGERNVASVIWSIKYVLPKLRSLGVSMPFEIVGEFPARDVDRMKRAALRGGLSSGDVRLLGFVDDITTVLTPGTLLLAPFERAAGVKVKCVDAMLRGCPVATTPAGARGTPLRHLETGIVSADADVIAREVARVISDPTAAVALAWKGLLEALDQHGPGMYRTTWQRVLGVRW